MDNLFELEWMCELNQQLFGDLHNQPLNSPKRLTKWLKDWNGSVMIQRVHGQPAGYAIFYQESNNLVLHRIGCCSRHIGQGVGAKLIKRIQKLGVPIHTYTATNNLSMINLATKCDFRVIKISPKWVTLQWNPKHRTQSIRTTKNPVKK